MNFSVLMSLYHKEQPENLRQSLASLRDQTRPADEIVLVLDGTITPELTHVIHDFQAALPIKIVPLPHNVGLGKALNTGMEHCTHEWIFRMDTDDIAVPNRFAWQCNFIAQHPDVQLLGGQITEFDTCPEQANHTRTVPQKQPEIHEWAKKRNPFNHMTIAYTRTAVQQVGGYQHHLSMEDYNLWLRMLANGVVAANLPDVLVWARTGEAMLQRRRGWTYVASEWQLFCLKRRLRFQATLPALAWFVLRSAPRLLPETGLQWVYAWLRR